MPELISRTVKATTAKRLDNKISNAVGKIMYKKLLTAQVGIQKKIEDLLVNTVMNTPVYKGLEGRLAAGGGDLQAEFGLGKEQQPEKALASLLEILKNTIRVEMQYSVGARTKAFVHIKMLNSQEYESKLKNGAEFKYDSKTKREHKAGKTKSGKQRYATRERSVEIRWMEWLLDNALSTDMTPNIKNYGIKYDLNPVQRAISRTGRAIMVRRARSNGNWTPYVLPRITQPHVKGSKNFIEDIALDRRFRKIVADTAEKALRRAFELKAKS